MNNAATQSMRPSELVLNGSWIAAMLGLLRGAGPYLALELILPGGTLLALLLWLYRRRLALRRR